MGVWEGQAACFFNTLPLDGLGKLGTYGKLGNLSSPLKNVIGKLTDFLERSAPFREYDGEDG